MNVLSLFDGISCGAIAFQQLNVKIDNYFSSEIDKNAIRYSMRVFPNIHRLGDVNHIDIKKLPPIDLLIGGSPCQGFSKAGKKLNFEDPRSKLFFKFVEILNEVNPKYFLLENVVMKKEWEDVISEHLSVKPIFIDSARFSAQTRQRMYWTNFEISLPDDYDIDLENVLEDNEFIFPAAIRGYKLNGKWNQHLEIRSKVKNKSYCLTTVTKDNVLSNLSHGKYPNAYDNRKNFRYPTIHELCHIQNIPPYFFDINDSYTSVKKVIGNGWEINTIKNILKNII